MSRIEAIQKMLEDAPQDTFLLYSLGMELLSAGSGAEAAERFNQVLQLDRTYLAAYGATARAMQEAGDPSGAASLLERGIAAAAETGDSHTADRFKLMLAAAKGES